MWLLLMEISQTVGETHPAHYFSQVWKSPKMAADGMGQYKTVKS